jgi:hypothetical protein
MRFEGVAELVRILGEQRWQGGVVRAAGRCQLREEVFGVEELTRASVPFEGGPALNGCGWLGQREEA